MATIVLVHGAWGGGWIWVRVRSALRAAGHEVYTPTLTGLGERAHLASRAVDLETHVADVLGVLKWERLENVTLVGHSYGGMVVTGVADRASERLGALIYLDAFLPESGQSLADIVGPEAAASMRRQADEEGEGWRVPPVSAAARGITDAADAAWLDALRLPHPLATFEQRLELAGNHLKVPKKAYILAAEYRPSPFHALADKARSMPGWAVDALPTHHIMMQSMPAETAAMLARYAA